VQVNARIREELRRQIVAAAEAHHLSFNQELTKRLEESFEKETVQTLANAVQSLAQDALRLRSLTDAVVERLQPAERETPLGMPPAIRNTVSQQQHKKEGGDT
jgi:hypothetical protein